MLENTKCKICKSTIAREIFNVSKYNDTYLDYLNIDYQSTNRYYKQCSNCKLVYRSVYLSDYEKEKLYSHFRDVALRNETHREYFERITSLPKEESENYEKYKFLEKFLKNSGKHMDVGGGLGVFSYGFKDYFANWSSLVVEPTDGAQNIAFENQIDFYNMYLTMESKKIIGENFDLITANHVLEHVDEPIKFLELLGNFINPEGFVYLEMPSTLDFEILDKSHDRFMSQHEVIYDEKSVELVSNKAGFNIFHIENYISKRGRNNVRALLKLKV